MEEEGTSLGSLRSGLFAGRPASIPPEFFEDLAYQFSALKPPPGLERPTASQVHESKAHQACHVLTPRTADPQYVTLMGPRRSESPPHTLGISMEDARSPDLLPRCPEPRRAFVTDFCEPSLSSPPMPLAAMLATFSELPDLPLFDRKELLADPRRPLSSVSTSAGPTPSSEDVRQVAGFQSPAFEESRLGGELDDANAANLSLFASYLKSERDWKMALNKQRDCEGVPDGVGPVVQRRESAPISGASLEALLQEGQLTSSVVAEMSKTQAGSKLLQKKLLKAHPSVIQDILEGLEAELPEIMCNMYGNYLCSAAFQSCSVAQRLRMLEISSRNLLMIAKDRWGTHAMQSLLSLVCTNDEQRILLLALKEHAVELSLDQHGSHVVQRAIISLGTPCPDALLHDLTLALWKVAYSPHGLCVLKRCISQTRSGPGQQHLIQEMSKQALDLVQSPYGNYVVQHSLQEWGVEMCRPMIQALRGKLLQLSLQKFSSNVVEYLLQVAPPEGTLWVEVVSELAKREQSHVLMSTVYGMHVARELLKVLNHADRMALEATYNATLRGNRNQCMQKRWESILSTSSSENPVATVPRWATPEATPAVHTPGRRRRGRGERPTPSRKQRGSPDSSAQGFLTPGLLVGAK